MSVSTVRAKFRLDSEVTRTHAGGYSQKTLEFRAVGDNNPENSQFAKATPSGTLQIVVENESAAEYFTPGEEYFLDFIKA